ncbi:HEAT repeat domain-containing protein [Sorangium sp. So ce321]|uniref:HEAT repeat domain-containing protein n=1 Tax=Sorangium sp. So ce321 TaxID=3133300 RepID=UPI003F60253F
MDRCLVAALPPVVYDDRAMMHLDDAFAASLRRADVRWLAEHLDEASCTEEVLRQLVRHDDARVRYLGLARLGQAAAARPGGAARRQLAALLPHALDGAPEATLLLARLHRELWPFLPHQRLPAWREAALPAPVRVAWLRTEVVTQPEVLRSEPAGELLYQALHALDPAEIPAPEALLPELAARRDPALQAAALDLTRRCLHAALLAPEQARAVLAALLDATAPATVAAALRELAAPWAALAGKPLPAARLRQLLRGDPEVAAAALEATARHGNGALLREALAHDGAPPRLRQQALELLGSLATRDDVGEILELAAGDPLLLGQPAIACLRALHRRGHFPAPEHAAALVDLALADPAISAVDVAAIAFTSRRALLEALAAAPAGDASWPRRAAIVVALAEQGAADLPLGDVLAAKLREAPSPAPFLRALGTLRHAAAEDDALAALPRAPAAALEALAAIGGRRTADTLRTALGLDRPGATVVPHLRSERKRAVGLLWHLTEDPGERRALLARLNPRELPAEIAADLGGADPAELAVLQRAVKRHTPADALQALTRAGDAGALPAIADLLLRITADLAAAWAPGGPAELLEPELDRRRERPAEPAVPAEVADAIRGLGRQLHRRRKIRPACLLDAASEREAGDALLASLALDLLDRPDLSPGERALLVDLLRAAPWRRALPRLPRLLRHRDPHVRKRVIALLAQGGAEALSARLTILTGAGDVQTARQALRALGGMEARWACPAIAACLDHPSMSIKKTAAEALARAGGPEAVPRLVFWLGRHDNPGFRAALEAALRALVGPACEATILAAAEAADDERTRDRLLDALSRRLTAAAIRSGLRQGSAAAARLLERVFAGEIALAAGTAADLAVELEAHGLLARERGPAGAPTGAAEVAAAEALALARDGWDDAAARRLLERQAALRQDALDDLRPLAPEWLRLAAAEPSLRDAALRLVVRASPAPWSPGEARAFARQAATIVDGLATAAPELRDGLLALLEAAAPELQAAEALGVAARVRGLAPVPGARRSPLEVLRRCGVILGRADVDQALAMARVAADPWTAEAAILRDAFGATAEAGAAADPEAASTWRAALRAAAREPAALAALRAAGPGEGGGSRAQLAALIEVFPAAAEAARAPLLDWMESLQPIGAPPWTLAERAATPAGAAGGARVPRPSDLDQPRSAALRARLLAMLDAPAPEQRRAAAAALLSWPDEDVRAAVLRAYLRGGIDGVASPCLGRSLLDLAEEELQGADGDEARRERAARLAALLDPPDVERLFSPLLAWWEAGAPATRAAAAQAIRRVAPDARAERLLDRLQRGAWGYLDLIAGEGLLRTPELDALVQRLRAEGRADLAERIVLDDGPLRPPGGAEGDARALEALRARPEPREVAARDRGPARQELVRLARAGDPEQSRRALTALAEAPDEELAALLVELLGDRRPRVRLHAHRLLRDAVDRAAYLRATCALLSDPLPDVVRSAIRILCFAPWPPAIPAIVGLLLHPHPSVRRAAADGLAHAGAPAMPALKEALGRARPDRREVYAEVMKRIEAR